MRLLDSEGRIGERQAPVLVRFAGTGILGDRARTPGEVGIGICPALLHRTGPVETEQPAADLRRPFSLLGSTSQMVSRLTSLAPAMEKGVA